MTCESNNWGGDLPLDAQQKREVFARFGLAAYQAQCLERQIGILLATTYNPDFLRSSSGEGDAFFESEFAKTLGRLVTALGQRNELAPEFESRLGRGVELRNWLTHHYFWDRAGWILTWEGREQMIRELQEAADTLSALDDELTAVSEEWVASVGVSKEAIEAEWAKYKLGHNA